MFCTVRGCWKKKVCLQEQDVGLVKQLANTIWGEGHEVSHMSHVCSVFSGSGCIMCFFLSLRLCILVPPDTLEEVLARLGSFHLRLSDTLPPSPWRRCEGQRHGGKHVLRKTFVKHKKSIKGSNGQQFLLTCWFLTVLACGRIQRLEYDRFIPI